MNNETRAGGSWRWMRCMALAGALWLAAAGTGFAQRVQAPAAGDPFAQSQLAQVAPVTTGATQVTLSGFVDLGYIHIAQQGPTGAPQNIIGWAYGNTQFNYFTNTAQFTLNQVELTLDVQKEDGAHLYGSRASLAVYPSRDTDAHDVLASDAPPAYDLLQAFVFFEWTQSWKTRVVLGRAPGFVTLAQREAEPPDLRLVGPTYMFQAGGGYPYGLQVHTQPLPGLWLKLGLSKGGLAGYSFYPGDNSASNDPSKPGVTYGNVDWLAFDEAAGKGTLRLGISTASSPDLTTAGGNPHPYSFSNLYAGYRHGSLEAQLEHGSLDTAYDGPSNLGWVHADITSLLLSWYAGANHLITLRLESMDFWSDHDKNTKIANHKNGITWRYRISDAMVLKVEAVQELQSPQFWDLNEDLTTKVLAASGVYSF
jgi:hypothetical protein